MSANAAGHTTLRHCKLGGHTVSCSPSMHTHMCTCLGYLEERQAPGVASEVARQFASEVSLAACGPGAHWRVAKDKQMWFILGVIRIFLENLQKPRETDGY